jgi:hypothetical protein
MAIANRGGFQRAAPIPSQVAARRKNGSSRSLSPAVASSLPRCPTDCLSADLLSRKTAQFGGSRFAHFELKKIVRGRHSLGSLVSGSIRYHPRSHSPAADRALAGHGAHPKPLHLKRKARTSHETPARPPQLGSRAGLHRLYGVRWRGLRQHRVRRIVDGWRWERRRRGLDRWSTWRNRRRELRGQHGKRRRRGHGRLDRIWR